VVSDDLLPVCGEFKDQAIIQKRTPMRTYLIQASLIIILTVLAVADAANTFGTYKINVAKSSYTTGPGRIDESMTVTREASSDGVKQTTNGEMADGSPFYASYTSKHDGTYVHVAGNAPFDTIAVKQVNANSVTDRRKKTGGHYNATGRTVFSNDGKTMTVIIKGTNADDKVFTQVLVFEKQ
jgi:hypothetical protein